MQGLVFVGDRRVALQDFPDPGARAGEVVVAIRASGMCGSDLPGYVAASAARGDPARASSSGHEPCGVVAERGPGVSERAGAARPARDGPPLSRLRRLQALPRGLHPDVRHGSQVMGHHAHGGHAPYLLAPAEHAGRRCRTSCRSPRARRSPAAPGTAYSALKRLDVSGRDTLAIFGQGPVGLAATQLATAMGARVVAVDPSPERRRLALRTGRRGGHRSRRRRRRSRRSAR